MVNKVWNKLIGGAVQNPIKVGEQAAGRRGLNEHAESDESGKVL
jgi:hypothetical protein